MKKYERTSEGMRKRRNAADACKNKQFNIHNGEPHTKAYLERERAKDRRRARRFAYATEYQTGGIK